MIKDDGIYGFFGPFRFLSNFHFVPIEYEGLVYPTTEHAYQAAKSDDPVIREFFAKGIATPREAKQKSQEILLKPDWHDIKYGIMLEITRKKYAQFPLGQWLLDTGDRYLEETNTWGDTYWGVCNGEGENNLGKILMLVRDELRGTTTNNGE